MVVPASFAPFSNHSALRGHYEVRAPPTQVWERVVSLIDIKGTNEKKHARVSRIQTPQLARNTLDPFWPLHS